MQVINLKCYLVIIIFFFWTIFTASAADQTPESVEDYGFEELVVLLKVNYEDTDIVSTALRMHNNNILVPLEDLKSFNLRPQYFARGKATVNGINYINLSKLQDVDYKIDEENLILDIHFPVIAMPMQNIDAHSNTTVPLEGYQAKRLNAFFMNYDTTITRQGKQYYVAGIQEFNYSNASGAFLQSVFTKANLTGKDKSAVVRLDTSWTTDIEDKMVQRRIGDSITKGSEWSSSTRFFGIQYATDFSIRPNFITYPLVDFAGRADLPSALDVYANSQLLYRTELKIGEFNMNDIPTGVGKGAIEIKQKDITGKIQSVSIPYYISPDLLSEGLESYSYAAGMQRLGYGVLSNKYRYLVTSLDYNKGLTNSWTSGVHFESMKNIFAIGTTNLHKISDYGIISTSIATSGPKLDKAQKGIVGYSFQANDIGVGIQQTLSGQNFFNTFNLDNSGVQKATQCSINYSLKDSSSISLTYTDAFTRSKNANQALQLISGTYQRRLAANSACSLTMGTDLKQKDSAYVYFALSVNLHNTSIGSSVYNQGKDITKQLGVSSNASDGTGSYSANVTKGKELGYNVQVMKALPHANTSLYFFGSGNAGVQQISLGGAVASTSEGVFFSRPIQDSFAVAKIGNFKDVGVYYNNQFVGKTNAKGVAFIPDVYSYIDSAITVDEQTLPLTAQFSDTVFIINAKRKTGAIANFDIAKALVGHLTLVDSNGTHLAQDAAVKIDGLEEQDLFVGYDGKVYIPDLRDLKEVNGSACIDENCCHFNTQLKNTESFDIVDLGVQTCR